jgi:hypothetical protein
MGRKILYILPRVIVFSLFIIYVIFALLTYFDYFEPYIYPLKFFRGDVEVINDRILIGPYPHYDELKRLKNKFGVTAIVSILDTRLPQERALQRRVEKMAERLDLQVYNFPMTWLNLNSRENRIIADRLIRFIVEQKDTNFYIHCYLGRHKVRIVKEGLKTAGLVQKKLPTENN